MEAATICDRVFYGVILEPQCLDGEPNLILLGTKILIIQFIGQWDESRFEGVVRVSEEKIHDSKNKCRVKDNRQKLGLKAMMCCVCGK
ncbi:hypothetical protein PIB30_083568, partial [Stylosanthes scabra]|nr:hypothetical protein [Stylosanthes scabra]